MLTPECLETLLQNELRELCQDCVHAEGCSYRRSTEKIIVQCALYVTGAQAGVMHASPDVSQGLCRSCTGANFCRLPGRHPGVFHCEHYA